MKLIFASNNTNKLLEIQQQLSHSITIQNLAALNFHEEIEETADTFLGNALIKVETIYNKYHQNCFADDSGLSVDYLKGAPGVYSARYAGLEKDDQANNQLLLDNLSGVKNRAAHFITVIALYWENELHYFEGKIEGVITEEARGTNGFGYDPLFIPSGYNKTFAEMTLAEKVNFSHRAIAINKMTSFIQNALAKNE